MSDVARAIKTEIERTVSRAMKCTDAAARLKDLARRLAALEKAVEGLDRKVERAIETASKPGRNGASGRRGRQFKATPESLRKLRSKLGVTQVELAMLVGVSGNAAWQWEAGRAAPRGKKVAIIQALGKLGKRDARRRLDSIVGSNGVVQA